MKLKQAGYMANQIIKNMHNKKRKSEVKDQIQKA